MLISTGILLLQ